MKAPTANPWTVIWACARKDILSATRDRTFTIAGLFLPVTALILMSLFVLAGSHAPTALVNEDSGPHSAQFVKALADAHSFRLIPATPGQATRMMEQGKIVASVTIPPDFSAKLDAGQKVAVPVTINNLNTDFTNDIRRGIPLAITDFYAQAFPHLVTITVHERDDYPHDTDYIPYLAVSILVIALMIGGLFQAGSLSAREWETGTVKELLLSPAPRWAVTTGKMLGSTLMGLGSAVVVIVVVRLVAGPPTSWSELIGFTLLCLVVFNAAGTLLGTLLRQRMPVIAFSIGISLPVFFISGSFGPISFMTPVLQAIAYVFPVYYQIVVMQHAYHGFTLNTLGVGANIAIVAGYGVLFILLMTLAIRRARITH